jgi:hypothetical protein
MRRVLSVALLGVVLGAGIALGLRVASRPAPLPEPPAVVLQLREVARLETLDLSLYKKVTFAPEPQEAGSFWGDVAGWARQVLSPPRGKAIVFADAHLSLDLEKLGPDSLLVREREAWLVLPPVVVRVELRPGDTEIIGSNLDSAQTARLFELAKTAFEREVRADARLNARARASAQRALQGLLLSLGFSQVHFVEALPGPA